MEDILERLKQTTKVNGAYPRDIADAIAEIKRLRNLVDSFLDAQLELEAKLEYYKGYHFEHDS